jgi:pimeloyl-ACP methyl ester carboxylesterase
MIPMKKFIKVIKIAGIVVLSLVLLMILGLFIYTRDAYRPLKAMYDEIELLDLEGVEVIDDFDQISYVVDQPIKNIVFVPGGKVKPESYQYLAATLALAGYDVTIVKTVFNLAILTPNYGARFLKDGIDNVVIGHSLGGTVASMFSSNDERITEMVFLASYPISDVSDKRVLVITGEFDTVLDIKNVEDSENLLPDDYVLYEILGGNHAQFGWYGPQKGDGTSTISTQEQQDLIVDLILDFID